MGLIEYVAIAIYGLMIADVVLGYISHVFKLQDNVSKKAENSTARKWALAVIVLMVTVFDLSDNFFNFQGIEPVLRAFEAVMITGMMSIAYSEFTSLMKHFANITGIKELEKIPGVKSEIAGGVKIEDAKSEEGEIQDDSKK